MEKKGKWILLFLSNLYLIFRFGLIFFPFIDNSIGYLHVVIFFLVLALIFLIANFRRKEY
jgi:hypothetical protein